jgi:S1-C subfamily serine protease
MIRRLVIAGLLLSLEGASVRADIDQRVLEAEGARIRVMARIKDSVISIFSASGEGGGSAVVISADGYALTNFHVAKPCGNAMQCGMPDGGIYDAVIVGADPTGDVALIKLFGRDDFPHAELGDSDQVLVGDWAIVMGNPFLLATDFQPTVTYGIISGVHRYQDPAGTLLEYADCIQTDASINPGNSGGPLFDAEGRLIGINGRGSFEKRGRVNVGAGYAISINQIKNFMGYLRSGRIVDHATLGATVGFDEEGRVVVTDILEGSDAYRRGLRYDDEIISFGGRPILTPNGFKNVLGVYPRGWRVPLSFRRDGKRFEVLVRLAGVHSPGELWVKAEGRPPTPPMPIPEPGEVPQPDQPPPGDLPEKEKRPPEERLPPIPGDRRAPLKPRREAPMPEVVKQHFEARQGYANYYFNKQHRQRIWDIWMSQAGESPADTWTIAGPLEGGGGFRLELSDDRAVIDLPAGVTEWTPTANYGSTLVPEGSGGLLPTLYLWRRLAVQGPDDYGDVYYLGTVPLEGHDDLTDVLVGVHGGVECRFFFDRTEGSLLAVEMSPDEEVDPCEVYFRECRQVGDRWIPGKMEIRHGDDVFGFLPVDRFDVGTTAR